MNPRLKIREAIKNLDRRGISGRILGNELTEEDQRILLFLVRVAPKVLAVLPKIQRRLGNLRDMIWGNKTESARNILKEIDREDEEYQEKSVAVEQAQPQDNASASVLNAANNPSADEKASNNVIPLKLKRRYKKNRKTSVRGVEAYPGADKEPCPHLKLKPGDRCPDCGKGTLYLLKKFGKFIQFIGAPLLKAKIFLQEKLRCNACGRVFSAPLPGGGASNTPSAAAMIALMKYGAGLPFFRMSTIQKYLKMPLSPSRLWQGLASLIEVVQAIFKELRRIAAQGEVFYNDDTVNKILDFIRASKSQETGMKTKKTRKKIFTTGILSKRGSLQIVLFFTGNRNAGENLEELFAEREKGLNIPIQMSDASTMNKPGEHRTHKGACLTHCRRGFVKSYRSEKKAAAYVIKSLREVYRIENQAKRLALNSDARLKLHQEKSGPIMEELKKWMDDQIETKKVEENSGLGDAIEYGRKHWTELTLFLRIAGAPLTNDELEQKFKMVKLHCKNSLFYKTLWGAMVGDMFMSVIHTCVLSGENPLDYLITIQENREKVLSLPGDWMPWNYRKTIAAATADQKTA